MNLLDIFTLIVMLVGLFGLVIPIFPGMIVMWLAALVFGLLDGFRTLGAILFVIISVLALVGTLVDNVLMATSSRQRGAAWSSIFLGSVAGVIGTIVFPPVGGLIAAPGLVLLLEYRRLRDWDKSWQAVKGLMTGWGLSFLARFAIGLAMVTLWLVWAWKG
ncbi:MAG: DUF456 domain-containing protein [Chloroflexota bacterium]